MRRRLLARVVEPLGERLVERLDDQGRFAAARDAGDAAEGAERDFGGDVLQVVAARADEAQDLPRMAGAAALGIGICRMPVRYWPVMLSGLAHHLVGRALGDDMAAMHAGARPHVDEPVGGADRLLVVLDDDDRVAEVAQPPQGRQQAGVVALVQPDRRLVEHIEHAGQPRADLRGEPDALALAARQRARGARQGQVFEPDILQKAEPLVDLLQDALRRSRAGSGSAVASMPANQLHCFGDRQARDLADVAPGDLDRQRLGLEPGAVADLAGLARSGSGRVPPAPRRCRSRESAAPYWARRPRTAGRSSIAAARRRRSS